MTGPDEPKNGQELPEVDEPLPEPPSPEDLERAERMLREARLLKMRGSKTAAGKLLDEALDLAPGAPTVLEAVADELRERRQTRAAMDLYKRALRLDPKSVSVERKYAECVLGVAAVADPFATTSNELDAATGKTAVLLSVLVPGLGQMVTGAVPLGVGLFVGWIVGWGIAWLIPGGMQGLLALFGARSGGSAADFNATVLLPILLALICHITAIANAASRAPSRPKQRVERPTPPVDKDFEL